METTNSDNLLIIPAFWVDDVPFPSETPIESPVGQVFFDEYDGNATHFGWMDIIQLSAMVKKGNISRIILQNLDTLGRAGLVNGKILTCTAYRYDSIIIHSIPPEGLQNCTPIYYNNILYSGWNFNEKESESLPFVCKSYMQFILAETKVKEVIYNAEKFSVTVYLDEKRIPRVKEKFF